MKRRHFLELVTTGVGSSAVPGVVRGAQKDADVLDCVVIGGGVSGLTAAWQLQGMNILLLEAEPRFGGRAISGTRDGWHYAKGTEYLGSSEGLFSRMLEKLGMSMVPIPSPMDIIYRDGKFYSGYAGRVQLLTSGKDGIKTFNRFLRTLKDLAPIYAPPPEYKENPILSRLDAMTCRQWFDEQGLPPRYAEMYDVMARGLFGANIDEVSALGAYEEIAYDFEGAEFIEDMDDVKALKQSKGRSGAFTFTRGIAEFTDALASALQGKVRSSARVSKVLGNDEKGYRVVYTDGSGREFTLKTRSVLLATPTPISLQIAGDVLSREQANLLGQIPYAPYVTVAVFSDKPIFDRAFNLALPGDFFFTDLYDSNWVQRQTDKAATSYKGHVASFYVAPKSFRDRALLGMTDGALLERCKKDLERVLPGSAARITGYDVHRHPYAYPVTTLGQFDRLKRLHKTLTGCLQLAGDGVVYPTFQTAMLAGEIAADRIMGFAG